MKARSHGDRLDEVDYRILEALLADGRITFKQLATLTECEERKVSRRVARMVKSGLIRGFKADIDWAKLGLGMTAFVGTRTAVDETVRKKLFSFLNSNPRVVSVDATVGANEYVFKAISLDLQDLRNNICTPLEPLTAGLSTSIVSGPLKKEDDVPLLRLAAAIASGGKSRSK